MRFLLEKSAAPRAPRPGGRRHAGSPPWPAPTSRPASRPRGRAGGRCSGALVAYAFLVRGFVALVGVVATRLGLGTTTTSRGLTFVPVALTGRTLRLRARAAGARLFWLTLVPQLVVWPVFTVLAGMAGAAPALAARRSGAARGERPGPRAGAAARSAHPAAGLADADAAALAAVGEARADEPRLAVVVARAGVALLAALPQEPSGRASSSSEPASAIAFASLVASPLTPDCIGAAAEARKPLV